MLNALYSIASISLCLFLGYQVNALLPGLPASLYGMITFTLFLHFRLLKADKLAKTIQWILKNMSVCFVPAGVGIINHFQLIKQHGLMLVAIIFITTFIVLTFVGLAFQRIESNKEEHSTHG